MLIFDLVNDRNSGPVLEGASAEFSFGFRLGIGGVEVEVIELELCCCIASLRRLRGATFGMQDVCSVVLQAVVLSRETGFAAGESATVGFLTRVDAVVTGGVAAGRESLVATGMLAGIAFLATNSDGAGPAVFAGTLGHAVGSCCFTVRHGTVERMHAIRAAAGRTSTVVVGIEIGARSVPLTWRENTGSRGRKRFTGTHT